MKQRFSSLDVKVIAHELANSLCSLRVANIYDLSSRVFLLKFAKPDKREQLIVESGFRCHLTGFSRATAAAPSGFVARLRKFLRTRRVTAVEQVGTDRIVQLQFSDGQYRLFLEFYAAGNIILTDKELTVIALLRLVPEGPDQEELRVGLKYSISGRQNPGGAPPLSKDRMLDGLRRALPKNKDEPSAPVKKQRGKAGGVLKRVVAASITEYPPVMIEHVIRQAGFDVDVTPEQILQDESLQDKLLVALLEAERLVKDILNSPTVTGYIIAKPKNKHITTATESEKPLTEEGEQSQTLIYDDFHPFKPQQFVDDPSVTLLDFHGYNRTVDEFFSSIEGQKLESRLQEREDNAKKRLEAARINHVKRVEGLQSVQHINIRKAQAIEANLQKVEEAIGAINGLIAKGMDWAEIARLIEMEQSRHNPVAEMFKLPLKLHENTITILIAEWNEDEDYEGDETDSDVSVSENEDVSSKAKAHKADTRLSVDVDLGISPWANARQYYDQKRSAAEKEQKTIQSSSKALKSTERKITADLKKGLKQEKQLLRPVRNQFWFEKFAYFISSDGYLVLGGRDIQQNEILYKRHLKRGDVYVHADLEGATVLIIKNNSADPEAPIPPSTLSQAGNLCVATSTAWVSKAVMSAWWVKSNQVSKSGPMGEYLAAGLFTILGEKHFLPPAQLLLGFGAMFQISDESKARHTKHRLREDDAKPDGEEFTESNMAGDDAEATQAETQSHQSESEADEEFPDAKLQSLSDDEDFPDANLESFSDIEDSHSHTDVRNPLQPDISTQSKRVQGSDLDDSSDEGGDQRSHEDEVGSQHEENGIADTHKPTAATVSEGVRHLSAAARRQLRKKRMDMTQLKTAIDGGDNEISSSTPRQDRQDDENLSGNATGKQQIRGKRGKQRKLATKYAEQDEEDRAQAMKLLGSSAAKEKAEEEARAKKAREEELARQKERRREQHLRAAREGTEQEVSRRQNQEYEIEFPDENEQSSTAFLDAFVGTPLPGDEILEAIPVCAPWSAMAKYKYKAKLQPGSQKKGKAIREILGRWTNQIERKKIDEKSEDTERMWPKELELIRAWKDTEVTNTVPVGKVRVMMSGGGESTSAGKSGQTKGKARGGKGSKKQR